MASKSATMEFHWNYGSDAIVQRKGFGVELNEFFAQTLLKYAEPYTPKLSGTLRDVAEVNANQFGATITYPGIPYDNYQYFADDSEWNRNTPGTTSRWLDYAWEIDKYRISGEVGAYRRWHSK